MTMEPLLWSSTDDTHEVHARLGRDGVCWIRMAGATELAQRAPQRLIETLLGWTPFATQVNQIKVAADGPAGKRPYAVTNTEARFHIDQHPYLPPALQLLVCVRQATDPGGVSRFVDTWKLLEQLAAANDPLFARLFEHQRLIRFHNFVWCAPTLSLRAGHLVCVHNGFPLRSDEVGTKFQQLLDRQQPVELRLETGDLLISNNHRTLHARTAFTDIRRHLVRILTWMHRPLPAPAAFVELATRVAKRSEQSVHGEPLWIRKRLGFSGLAAGYEHYDADDLLAHYRGELRESPDQEVELIRASAQTAERRAS